MSDQPHNTHNSQTSMYTSMIRTHNTSKRAAADPRLRLRGHWARNINYCVIEFVDWLLAPEILSYTPSNSFPFGLHFIYKYLNYLVPFQVF